MKHCPGYDTTPTATLQPRIRHLHWLTAHTLCLHRPTLDSEKIGWQDGRSHRTRLYRAQAHPQRVERHAACPGPLDSIPAQAHPVPRSRIAKTAPCISTLHRLFDISLICRLCVFADFPSVSFCTDSQRQLFCASCWFLDSAFSSRAIIHSECLDRYS